MNKDKKSPQERWDFLTGKRLITEIIRQTADPNKEKGQWGYTANYRTIKKVVFGEEVYPSRLVTRIKNAIKAVEKTIEQ